jgi:lysyl-tRNA synthetase class 2
VETVTSGRIIAIRGFGKANFLALSDGRSRIQAYIRQDSLAELDFQVFKLLDIGDFVGVRGYLFRTRTNELTIWAEGLTFLSKCLIPLPEKWHGLQDIELRYRQRYLDLVVNPEQRRVFEVRSRVLGALREFLDARDYLEVETPMMQPIAGGALARPFVTHHNALDLDLFLRIAPELYLKRLVVGGMERVYEINRNFRNEGISTQHNPEFTMLEFYQAYSDYRDLMAMTEELLLAVARGAVGADEVAYGDDRISFRPPFARVALREAVREAAGRRLGAPVSEEDLRDGDRAAAVARRLGVATDPGAGPGKTTMELFEALCESSLVQPTFVYDFPTEVSPLSKQRPDDPDTVERFELYVGRFEVANAFSELNDPAEQRRRFEAQLRERQQGNVEAHVMDEDYVRALEYGMPPTAGEGIGVDRLVMLLTNSSSIRDVILFPLLRPRRD